VDNIKRSNEVNTRIHLIRLGFTAGGQWAKDVRMKKIRILLALAVVVCLPFAASAQISAAAKPADPNPAAKKVCETISTVTGVAISPLMGVGLVGAYDYFKAKTDEAKAKLPWFANPLFFVPALLLVGACFLKDTVGITIPTVLKKPFDIIETAEHKVSGLVATGAFVPLVVNMMHEVDTTAGTPSASLHSLGFAAVTLPNWLYDTLMTPVAMAAFFIVFLASNAINILILLSPFTTVDAGLKAFRTAILASVAASAWLNPWIGAAWAVIVILISYLIAGWSFRLSHFGLVFIWEFFTGSKSRFQPDTKENKMFLGRKTEKVPTRTYGKLSKNEKGELVFNYRPWLVLPQRTLVLPTGNYEAGRGIFYSEILRIEGDSARTVLLLPPRYRGHEEEIARIYQFAGVRDIGLRAAWAWFKSLFGGKTAAA
jgi:hypothetical protein